MVFLSYSRDDRQFAFRMAEDLKSAGTSVWLDQRDIALGDHWDMAVETALTDCRCVIVILSPSSVCSRNVLDEVACAVDNGKRIMPVLYRDCVVPLRLRRMQYQDFRDDYVSAFNELLRSLSVDEACKTAAGASSTSPVQGEHVDLGPAQFPERAYVLVPPHRPKSALIFSLSAIIVLSSVTYLVFRRSSEDIQGKPAPSASAKDPVKVDKTETPGRANVQLAPPLTQELMSGEWHSDVFVDPQVVPQASQQYYFKFKVIGARLSGTVLIVDPPDKPTGIVYGIDNGRVDGNTITFDYLGNWKRYDGTTEKESFLGKVTGNRIEFVYQREGSVPVEFRATKVIRSSP